MNNNVTIRPYVDDDYEMIREWWESHSRLSRPKQYLPKCGVVCEIDGEPISALFLHMDNSCGMCMIDHAVAKPKLPLAKSMLAFKHSIACLRKVALEFGYHSMTVITYPGISRILRKLGFAEISRNQVSMIGLTKEAA
jgi:hypothetical protein